jgi:hypothetical protein
MNDIPGEETFLQELEATGQIWVVKGESDYIYALELDDRGFSLPVWSCIERVLAFMINQQLVGTVFLPFPIPLDVFAKMWLDNMIDVNELLINLDGKSTRAVVLTIDEFRSSPPLQDALKVAS